MHSPRKLKGVTLIELMIVVIIIGILAAFAYPQYVQWVAKSNRTDAHIALTRIAAQQEKFYSDCGYYAANLTGTRACGADSTAGVLGATNLSPENYYGLSLAAGTITAATCSTWACGFTATADPNTGTSSKQRDNGKLRLDSSGVKQWDKQNNNSYSNKWTDK